jgi:hypothetical protein
MLLPIYALSTISTPPVTISAPALDDAAVEFVICVTPPI